MTRNDDIQTIANALLANDAALDVAMDDVSYHPDLKPLMAALRASDDAELGRMYRERVMAGLRSQAEDALDDEQALAQVMDAESLGDELLSMLRNLTPPVAPKFTLWPCAITGDGS